MDTNSHLDINTLSDGTDRDISMYTVTKPWTGKLSTHAHTGRDEIFCDICAETKVKITHGVDTHLADTETEMPADMGARSDYMSTDKRLFSLVISHTRGQHINNGTSRQNLDPSIEVDTHTATRTETHSDPAHIDTQLGKYGDSGNTNRQLHNSTNTGTRNKQKGTSVCLNSQDDQLSHTHTAAGTNTYGVAPTDLYNGDAHNDTRFNSTFAHPDTHLYFLYYLSQYFNLVSSVLFYLSAAVNPLLYNLMSARYRHAVHSLIHTHSQTQTHRLRSTLMARHSTTTL